MTNYFWTNEHIDENGVKHTAIVPWSREDFKEAMRLKGEEITTRRRDEALISQEGMDWFLGKRTEIALLKQAMDAYFPEQIGQ